MKKYICVLAALMLLLALTGCGGQAAEPTEPTQGQTAPGETKPAGMTEQDLLRLFSIYAGDGWSAVDCVAFEESGCGISGVIAYTKPGYDGTMFDFIREGMPLTTGVEAKPVGSNAALTYAGNDQIVCRLKNGQGEFTCVISCSVSGGEVNFKISGGGEG